MGASWEEATEISSVKGKRERCVCEISRLMKLPMEFLNVVQTRAWKIRCHDRGEYMDKTRFCYLLIVIYLGIRDVWDHGNLAGSFLVVYIFWYFSHWWRACHVYFRTQALRSQQTDIAFKVVRNWYQSDAVLLLRKSKRLLPVWKREKNGEMWEFMIVFF